ncbi:PD-(D/E)XK nuclease family protein [Noviherbaspirillum humi]|nr:PD-(D/E)XK nuclease family protein [Noviherbaspirillum humi]
MLHASLLIPPGAAFWRDVAAALARHAILDDCRDGGLRDLSGLRVLVPSFLHAQQLKSALARELGHAFIPPRVTTLSAWLGVLMPDASTPVPPSPSERLMALYDALRQHAWIKRLFTARRNTDLLPLAQTLLALFDELTTALLPVLEAGDQDADDIWEAALQQLAPAARGMLSDEAQLVWMLWKTQLDGNDAAGLRYRRMLQLADEAACPLVWIDAGAPDAMIQSFLDTYALSQPVLPVRLAWQAAAVHPAYAGAWREAFDDAAAPAACALPPGLSLCPAASLEDEAARGAQTVIDWLRQGKDSIAIIAQDRMTARRVRALLERAKVFVCDETGWQLSTTRAAAALAALLDAVATRAETVALLDLLKSPFVLDDVADKPDLVMALELSLRRANVLGGWEAALHAASRHPEAQALLQQVEEQARKLHGRKPLGQWIAVTDEVMQALGMHSALAADHAGEQVIGLLDALRQHCARAEHMFSFSEWRAFLGMQMEATPYIPNDSDRRVVMLQLAGARLRCFDAVLMIGADADHLPSQQGETLFFANAVRRELGLATREQRHTSQLRDFIELLSANREVVLSWQAQRHGDPNPPAAWIERLQLALERGGAGALPKHEVRPQAQTLQPLPVTPPAAVAPDLLPQRLSASAYNSLVACPYQFFANRMLGLTSLDELSDMPEKSDYGDWLHRILATYHETLRTKKVTAESREALLRDITEQVFSQSLDRSAAALGFYDRWQKTLPAYLAWAEEREADGWQFVFGERVYEKTLHWDGGKITLHGRIDRVDENADGERAILDYKTSSMQALRDRLKEGEDHQLAFYGMLSDLPVSQAHYVALEPGRAGTAEPRDLAQWQRLLEERLVATMQAIAKGAPLQASGINQICQYCDVRGLCRKGAW